MLMLNRRLQILVEDERFDRLAEESKRIGAPVGELVRRAIDREFPPRPLEPADLQRGIDLFETHPDLDAGDAVFAALALNRRIDAILATDRAFEGVDGLERIDPSDDQALATLTG